MPEKNSVTERFMSRMTVEEEELQDWLNGSGQIWLGLMAFVLIAVSLWVGFF